MQNSLSPLIGKGCDAGSHVLLMFATCLSSVYKYQGRKAISCVHAFSCFKCSAGKFHEKQNSTQMLYLFFKFYIQCSEAYFSPTRCLLLSSNPSSPLKCIPHTLLVAQNANACFPCINVAACSGLSRNT